jgi:nitrite reductase (cytochrome c-552)
MELIDTIRNVRASGVADSALTEARRRHRQAQWRLDFVMAENSTGFHAPQEAARILAEAIDLARQGQILAIQAQQQQLKTGNASPEK